MPMTPDERREKKNAWNRAWYHANQEQRLEYHRGWRRKNADKLKARSKGYALKSMYGITESDFTAMLAAQGSRCGVCGSDKPGGAGSFHVDHNHVTGVVRGLLCHYCNLGLGAFRDNPALLELAKAYLEKTDHKKEN